MVRDDLSRGSAHSQNVSASNETFVSDVARVGSECTATNNIAMQYMQPIWLHQADTIKRRTVTPDRPAYQSANNSTAWC